MKKYLVIALGVGLLGLVLGCGEGQTVTKPENVPPPPSDDAAQKAQNSMTLGAPAAKLGTPGQSH